MTVNKKVYSALMKKDKTLAEQLRTKNICTYQVLFEKGVEYEHNGDKVVLEEDYVGEVTVKNSIEADMNIRIDPVGDPEESEQICLFVTSAEAYYVEKRVDTFISMIKENFIKKDFLVLANNIEKMDYKIV